jgi:hypothetical protein
MTSLQSANFRSFWMGGFEAASHVNRFQRRVDMIAGTHHDALALTDYQLLKDMGIRGARDAVRWHLVDKGDGSYDFSLLLPQLEAACATSTQVIWSLCHYGFPDDLDLFSAEFIHRFVGYSLAVATMIREHSDEVPYFTPIDEISFFSWAASRVGFRPFAEGRDKELKHQLVRATIAACEELRIFDNRCRFVFPEPIIHVVAPQRIDLALLAQMADQRPHWQLIMVRPVVKIDPAALPKRPNIHYLGGKDYRELPAYIKGWDVCLMRFAMNESTKFISPTKVLEYMAAGKPRRKFRE